MGGQSSKPQSTAKGGDRNYNVSPSPLANGTPDTYGSEETDNDCECTFFNPFAACKGGKSPSKADKLRKKNPFGTPIADSPMCTMSKRFYCDRSMFLEREKRASEITSSSAAAGGSGGGGSSERMMEATKREIPGLQSLSSRTRDASPSTLHEGSSVERKLFEKYEICEVLGVGSTSTVHKCRNRETGEICACKIIDSKEIETRFQGMMDQFHNEVMALRFLHHPNIITLYDVYLTDDKIYIIMELMEGGELFDYVVRKGTLTEDEASRIVRKVASALVYMHSQNIIHRDLKPENLLLKRQPRSPSDIEIKIIDFGLSKELSEPVARTFLGTRGYLAPEMIQRKNYTTAVDAWALGVIIFVLLCGCLPFDDDANILSDDAQVQQKFKLRFPRWAKNLSSSAKDLLSHLLDINPNTRYTAETALEHPWIKGLDLPKNNYLQSPGRMSFSRSPKPKRPGDRKKHTRDNSGGWGSKHGYGRQNSAATGAPRHRANSHDVPGHVRSRSRSRSAGKFTKEEMAEARKGVVVQQPVVQQPLIPRVNSKKRLVRKLSI